MVTQPPEEGKANGFTRLTGNIPIKRIACDELGADNIAAADVYYFPNLKKDQCPELCPSVSKVVWKLSAELTAS